MKNCFIRGSIVHNIKLKKDDVDPDVLMEAARRDYQQSKKADAQNQWKKKKHLQLLILSYIIII